MPVTLRLGLGGRFVRPKAHCVVTVKTIGIGAGKKGQAEALT